jgi:hypothetical protein
MTLPAGTDGLVAVVTPPTARLAAVSAAVAAAWVRPTTPGTVTWSTGGPEEMVKLTDDPDATEVPEVGDWSMTVPAGTLALAAVPTAPTARWAWVRAASAPVRVKPTTLGTVTWDAGGSPELPPPQAALTQAHLGAGPGEADHAGHGHLGRRWLAGAAAAAGGQGRGEHQHRQA